MAETAQQDATQGALEKAYLRSAPAWLGRWTWLAVVGIFPLAIAQWLPWFIERDLWRFPGETPYVQSSPLYGGLEGFAALLRLLGLSEPGPKWVLTWIALAFAPAGIFSALALNLQRRSRLAGRVYGIWLLIETAIAAVDGIVTVITPDGVICTPATLACPSVTRLSVLPTWGLWMALGALALLWVAAGARYFGSGGDIPSASAQPETEIAQAEIPAAAWRVGAGTFALGGLIWAFGIILTPWAVSGCAGFLISWTHISSGACEALDVNDLMPWAWANDANPTGDAYIIFVGILILIGLCGVIAGILAWRRGWLAPIAALIWSLAALALAFDALYGLHVLQGSRIGLSQVGVNSAGRWDVGAGPWICGVGLALCWVGVLALGALWLRGRRAALSSQG